MPLLPSVGVVFDSRSWLALASCGKKASRRESKSDGGGGIIELPLLLHDVVPIPPLPSFLPDAADVEADEAEEAGAPSFSMGGRVLLLILVVALSSSITGRPPTGPMGVGGGAGGGLASRPPAAVVAAVEAADDGFPDAD